MLAPSMSLSESSIIFYFWWRIISFLGMFRLILGVPAMPLILAAFCYKYDGMPTVFLLPKWRPVARLPCRSKWVQLSRGSSSLIEPFNSLESIFEDMFMLLSCLDVLWMLDDVYCCFPWAVLVCDIDWVWPKYIILFWLSFWILLPPVTYLVGDVTELPWEEGLLNLRNWWLSCILMV